MGMYITIRPGPWAAVGRSPRVNGWAIRLETKKKNENVLVNSHFERPDLPICVYTLRRLSLFDA